MEAFNNDVVGTLQTQIDFTRNNNSQHENNFKSEFQNEKI